MAPNGTGILVAGDALVDLLPDRPGPVSQVDAYEPRFGGSGANVAVALDRFGIPPLLWTRLATDGFGEFLAGVLAETAIPDRFLVRDPDAQTALAVVTHDETGEREFSFYRAGTAYTRMQPGTVPDEALADRSWVHVTGVSLSVEPSRSAVLDLLERAQQMGVTTSLDPNWRPELWNSRQEFAAVMRGALELIDVVKGTTEEFATAGIDGGDPETVARRVSEYGPETVLVTLGETGALCYGTGESPIPGTAVHDGFDVDVVDTTGAGDAFLAAAIATLEAGETDGRRTAAVANAAGALATTRSGAVRGLTGPEGIRELVGELPWD